MTDPDAPISTTLPHLSERSPFAWLRERDVDLLVCSELHAGGALTRLLAERIGAGDAAFAGAWVSHDELEGESDLVVAYQASGGQVLALIENKVAAGFQPDQGARYASRAARWRQSAGIVRVVTVLLAPADYLSRPGSETFEESISYDEAIEALRAEHDARSAFLAEALLAGIRAYRQGYVAKPDERVSNMWMACWEAASELAPALRFAEPGLKPGQSTWFYFRDADGFAADRKRVVVAFKAERGQVDLQFAATRAEELAARCAALLEPGMQVVQAAKSASIRLIVPKIDFAGSAEAQRASMVAGFEACERLRAMFVTHRAALLGDPTVS